MTSHNESRDSSITTDDEYLLDQVLEAVRDYTLIQQTNLRGEVVLDGNEFRIEKVKAMRGVKEVLDNYIGKQVRKAFADMIAEAAERGLSLEQSLKVCDDDEEDEAEGDHSVDDEFDETVPSQSRKPGRRPVFVR